MSNLNYNTIETDKTAGFTCDEIEEMLRKSSLDEETKSEINSFIAGAYQCIFNIVNTDNFEHTEQARLINTPDFWEVGYNEIIKIFQKHHDCIPAENFETIYGAPFDHTKFGGK